MAACYLVVCLGLVRVEVSVCVCACVCVCVRACVCACMCVRVRVHGVRLFLDTQYCIFLSPLQGSPTLRFTGSSTILSYETLLRSLTYTNTNPEPTPGNRSITITISDGIHNDVTAVIVIVVLLNDNPITLQVTYELYYQ